MSAERDHCIEVANEHSTGSCDHHAGTVKMGYWEFVDFLMRERASARERALDEMRAAVRKALGEDAT